MANYTLNYTGEDVDKLLNKVDTAFGEKTVMSDTLTWDGKTYGTEVIDPLGNGYVLLCRVSDSIPTADDFTNGASLTFSSGGGIEVPASNILPVGNGVLVESNFNFAISPSDNISVTIPYNGTNIPITFPKKGVYFSKTADGYPSLLTINGYTDFEITEIKTIDSKYMPIMRVNLSGIDISEDIGSIPYTPLYEHFSKGGIVEFVSDTGNPAVGLVSLHAMRAVSCSLVEISGEETYVKFGCIDPGDFNVIGTETIVVLRLTTP